MSESTPSALVVREDSLAPAAVQARIAYAKSLAASSLLPDAYRQQPANVLLAIEYGQSLGIKPIAALNGINVIKGKPTMSADLMASVVRKAGHKLRIIQEGMSVRAQLVRSDDPEFTYEVVWDEARARRAQLWGQRGPWSLYPEQMLRSRAITEVCRQGASDCLFGIIYSPEEIGGDEHGPDVEVGLDVVFLGYFEQLQWLFNHVLQDGRGEILVDVFLVDRYLASTFREVNTSYSALAATNCIYYFHLSPYFLYWLISIAFGLCASRPLSSVPSMT